MAIRFRIDPFYRKRAAVDALEETGAHGRDAGGAGGQWLRQRERERTLK